MGIRELPLTTTYGPAKGVDICGLRIAVLPLNSALFCLINDDYNKLVLDRRCLQKAIDQVKRHDVHLRLALVHHPLDWLSDIERSNIRASLQDVMDVVLRGHLHETDAESAVARSGVALHLAAGATYQTRKWPNCALLSTYDQGCSVRLVFDYLRMTNNACAAAVA